jgi:hypothetical protein
VKLLIDHNLPPRLAVALHTIFEPEHEIVSLWTKFGRHNLKDEDWIPALGEEGSWAVLSADLNIARKRPSPLVRPCRNGRSVVRLLGY